MWNRAGIATTPLLQVTTFIASSALARQGTFGTLELQKIQSGHSSQLK